MGRLEVLLGCEAPSPPSVGRLAFALPHGSLLLEVAQQDIKPPLPLKYLNVRNIFSLVHPVNLRSQSVEKLYTKLIFLDYTCSKVSVLPLLPLGIATEQRCAKNMMKECDCQGLDKGSAGKSYT